MARKKIVFQDLVHPWGGSLSVKIQVLHYILTKAKEYKIRIGWGSYGWDKILYGYSGNERKSYTRITPEMVELMLYRAFFSEHSPDEVLKFRKHFSLDGKARFFELDFENFDLHFGNYGIWMILSKLKMRKLKKEFYHPDYPERLEPYIQDIKFTISESGYHIFYDFCFENDEGVSSYEYWSDGRSLNQFLNDTFKDIDNKLIEPFILQNETR